MMVFIIGIVVGGTLIYLLVRLPKNQFLAEVAKMPLEKRAAILLQATLLRISLGADYPNISSVLLNPISHSKTDCKAVRNILFDLVNELERNRKHAEKRFREIGIKIQPEWREINSTLLNSCYVWIQTTLVGDGHEGAFPLWSYLRESAPYLSKAIDDEKTRHEIAIHLRTQSNFLNGLPVDLVVKEANRWPMLAT